MLEAGNALVVVFKEDVLDLLKLHIDAIEAFVYTVEAFLNSIEALLDDLCKAFGLACYKRSCFIIHRTVW